MLKHISDDYTGFKTLIVVFSFKKRFTIAKMDPIKGDLLPQKESSFVNTVSIEIFNTIVYKPIEERFFVMALKDNTIDFVYVFNKDL